MLNRFFLPVVWVTCFVAVSAAEAAGLDSSSIDEADIQGDLSSRAYAQHAMAGGEFNDSRTDNGSNDKLRNEPVGRSIEEGRSALNLLADIRVHSSAELKSVLLRVDDLFAQGAVSAGTESPVVFLLHGSEAKTLFKSRYNENKTVVDLAAKLSAFGVVDIKVCETWAGNKGLDTSNLQPFIGTIPYAPAEEKRLLEEQGYTHF